MGKCRRKVEKRKKAKTRPNAIRTGAPAAEVCTGRRNKKKIYKKSGTQRKDYRGDRFFFPLYNPTFVLCLVGWFWKDGDVAFCFTFEINSVRVRTSPVAQSRERGSWFFVYFVPARTGGLDLLSIMDKFFCSFCSCFFFDNLFCFRNTCYARQVFIIVHVRMFFTVSRVVCPENLWPNTSTPSPPPTDCGIK